MTTSTSNNPVKIKFKKITAHKISSIIMEVHPKDDETSSTENLSTVPASARDFSKNIPNSIGPLVYVDKNKSVWYIHVTAHFKEHVQWKDISLPETANIYNKTCLSIQIKNENLIVNKNENRFHWELIFTLTVTPEVEDILASVEDVNVEIDFNENKKDDTSEGDPRRGTRVILT